MWDRCRHGTPCGVRSGIGARGRFAGRFLGRRGLPQRGRVSSGTPRCGESNQHLAIEGAGVEVLRADERPTDFRFAPGLLAYVDPHSDEGGDETVSVTVFNTQARAQLTDVDAGNGAFQPDYQVTEFNLAVDGATAWITEVTPPAPNPSGAYVFVNDAMGTRQVAGPAVDPNSLGLSGTTVSWTSGGQPASTQLAGAPSPTA